MKMPDMIPKCTLQEAREALYRDGRSGRNFWISDSLSAFQSIWDYELVTLAEIPPEGATLDQLAQTPTPEQFPDLTGQKRAEAVRERLLRGGYVEETEPGSGVYVRDDARVEQVKFQERCWSTGH